MITSLLRTMIVLLLAVSGIQAHQTGLSLLQINETSEDKITMVYKKPLEDSQADDIFIRFPSECREFPIGVRTIENGYIIHKSSLACHNGTLMQGRIWVEGLVASDRGVMVHYSKGDFQTKALLRASTPFMFIDQERSFVAIAFDYIWLGITHILKGLDHLFFVLGLLLLVPHLKALLFAITAFTLSHSLTLILGIFNIITIPIVYVESMIAFSVIFLAREILYKEMTFTKKYLSSVSFIFGLLHGLGFSSVLTSIGLPQEDIPLALFAFNVGIEIGQLLFIGLVGMLYVVLKRSKWFTYAYAKRVIAYIIGSVATFWFIERVLIF